MASNNEAKKKRSIEHYLHKQWIATKMGRDLHDAECKRMRELPVKAKQVK